MHMHMYMYMYMIVRAHYNKKQAEVIHDTSYVLTLAEVTSQLFLPQPVVAAPNVLSHQCLDDVNVVNGV